MAIRIKYNHWFVCAIVTSMANKRRTFFSLQAVMSMADYVSIFFRAPLAFNCAISVVSSECAAVQCKQRYKFMEISI